MPSKRRSILVSILFVVFGGPGLLLVYLPFWITRFRIAAEPRWLTILACALIVLGLTPLFESIVRFIRVGRGTLVPNVPTERLVVTGLYRHVRNPMYVGVLTSLAGEALLFEKRGMAVLLAAVWLGMHLFVCLYEEPTLTRRHPADYPDYQRHVPRWLPRFTPWRSAQQ
ncbi:MAG: isoprenylcysteine carboxylmethyltransferase family protein [Terracidiphilus sp.]